MLASCHRQWRQLKPDFLKREENEWLAHQTQRDWRAAKASAAFHFAIRVFKYHGIAFANESLTL